jgi:hypothetical protein
MESSNGDVFIIIIDIIKSGHFIYYGLNFIKGEKMIEWMSDLHNYYQYYSYIITSLLQNLQITTT